jgi:hypothetical protein
VMREDWILRMEFSSKFLSRKKAINPKETRITKT